MNPHEFDRDIETDSQPDTSLRHFDPQIDTMDSVPPVETAADLQTQFEAFGEQSEYNSAAEAYETAAMLTEAYRIRANRQRSTSHVQVWKTAFAFAFATVSGALFVVASDKVPDAPTSTGTDAVVKLFVDMFAWSISTPEFLASVAAGTLSLMLINSIAARAGRVV